MEKRIVIGSDKSGFPLKEEIKEYLISEGYKVEDVGMQNMNDFMGFYEVAPRLAKKIQNGEYEKGILICGTGAGMSIVANKFKGIYAVAVEGSYAAMMSKVINNANVITMGGWKLASKEAIDMVNRWLNYDFGEGIELSRKEFLINAKKEIEAVEEENFK